MDKGKRKLNNSDRRRHPRISTNMKLMFTIENDPDPDSVDAYPGEVLQISQGGMRFKTRCHLWRDAQILFTVRDRGDISVVSGTAQILNISGDPGQQIIGCKFIEFIMHDAA